MRRAVNSLKEIAQIKEESRGFVITLDGAVLFLLGKATLLPEAQTRLDQVAKTLLDLGATTQLRVEGHTDSTGTVDDNMQLSQQRAQSVADYLVTRGIDSSRLQVAGMGESQPIASNDDPQGRANNRRVEIIVTNPNAGAAKPAGQSSPTRPSPAAPPSTNKE
jgi:outer membrane protein OmpA-like peptidoglycan-associated protein